MKSNAGSVMPPASAPGLGSCDLRSLFRDRGGGAIVPAQTRPDHASLKPRGNAQHHAPANAGRGVVALERLRVRQRFPQRRVRGEVGGEGLTGPAPIFEGEMGFFRQVSGEFELPPLGGESDANADDFMINKTSIKFWPAEYHSQSAIHAALELRPQIADVSAIQSIVIESFDAAVDIIGKDPEKWRPKTRETADHSLPYCTAVALMEGDVTLASFDESPSKQC